MLNSKKLGELLNQNVHPKLFPKWIVMSPNATLLAYTGHSNIKELRDQAALISVLWREAEQNIKSTQPKPKNTNLSSSGTLQDNDLETLTIESEISNIIVRAIQPRLLLVLVGGRPPTQSEKFFKITSETRGDARYPPADCNPTPLTETAHLSTSATGAADSESSEESTLKQETSVPENNAVVDVDLRLGLLHIQRKKVDAATDHMRADFLLKGFTMPDDLSIP